MNEGARAEPTAREADTPGELLKRERERACLTVQQAAEDLHLDPWIIEAIESNRFLALGAPVYARGHLRKYATRLGVPADDILARYESVQDRPHETDPIPTAVAAPVRQPRKSRKKPALAVLAVLVLGALAYLAVEIFFESPGPSSQENTSATVPPVVEPVQAPSAPAESSPRPQLTEAPAEVQSAQNENAAPAAALEQAAALRTEASASSAAAPVASSDAPTVRVRLEFTDESWAEVYDANGTRLFFGMGTPQRVRTLAGTPPLQVTLGAASAVNLQVNGESTVIPRREGREFARFTIDANGNLR